MLTTLLVTAFLSQTADASLGDVGESCRARSDCRAGLKCVNSMCTAPIAATKEGLSCEATSDCSSDGSLRCVAKVCKARSAAPVDTTAGFSPPPPPPEPYQPANARLTEPPPPSSRSATLIAQAPPPIPTRGGLSLSQQVMQLESDIDGINAQLRGIDTSWPGGSIALVVIGAVLSPAALVGLILMVFPPVGIPFLAVGLGGVAMIIVGAVGGSRAKDEAVAQREELIQRRQALERDLSNLKRTAGAPSRADAAMLTIAAF
ncbi:MAG: hypothetical protein JNJ54_30040 [Myxococcaceae bacterium]|nr:hypothetical protein [Myxococcaceae bacterium]